MNILNLYIMSGLFVFSSPFKAQFRTELVFAFSSNMPLSTSTTTKNEQVTSPSPERKTLIKGPRVRPRLRLPGPSFHSTHYIAEPSPVTPCSVFSFDLPNSPAVLEGRPGFSRSQSCADTEMPLSPRSIFSFELPFDFGSQRTLRTPTVPATPLSPGLKSPIFPHLPTINEARGSISESKNSSDENGNLFPAKQKTDWSSIRLIMIVILFTRIQFTVYFASLWPFLQEIDSSATTQDFAFINAAYSIGIAGSAPLFGYWSNKLGCIRIPSISSLCLMMFTNILYILLVNISVYGKFAMGFARFLAGIAAGGNALLPTYWTYAAAPEDRSIAAAMFDGAFCLGIAIGPGLQLLFSLLKFPGPSIFNVIFINMYTLPAMVSILLVASAMFLMTFKFKEAPMASKTKRNSVDSTASSVPILPPCDKLAVLLCIFGKMVQMFIYASMETIGGMYTQKMFGLSRTETTQFNSILVGCSGLVGFLFLVTYVWTKTGKKVDNRIGVLSGVSVCVLFIITTYPWYFYTEPIQSADCTNSWCESTPKIPQNLYALAYILVFGIGFAMMNVHLAALYSSVLGPRRQGTMHGINTLLASCSRVLGPVAVTDMFTDFGPRSVWAFQLGTWGLLMVPFLIFYKRMVPCLPIEQPVEELEPEEK